jgi:glycosyltransferase involved in cell wall biosynthesis
MLKPDAKLRILMMGNMAPFRIGGAEVQTRRLAETFARRGHTVTVAGYANPNTCIAIKDQPTISINSRHLPVIGTNRLTRAVSFSLALSRFLLCHSKCHDVLFGYVLGESALVAGLLKYMGLLNLPMVICSACSGLTGDAAFLTSLPGTRFLVAMLRRSCDRIIILSPRIEEELRFLRFDPARFSAIPCGLPVADEINSPQRTFFGQRSFLYVGRLAAQKGVSILLLALRQLNDWGYLPEVHIVGTGPLQVDLQQQARRLGIEPAPIFHGQVQPEEVHAFYQKDAVFVLPSLYEGQPNVLLEAMAAGLPVITTRSGGSEYLVSDRMGIVCPPGDPGALASAMRTMMELPRQSLSAKGRAARQYTRENNDIEKVVDQYLALFTSLRKISSHSCRE